MSTEIKRLLNEYRHAKKSAAWALLKLVAEQGKERFKGVPLLKRPPFIGQGKPRDLSEEFARSAHYIRLYKEMERLKAKTGKPIYNHTADCIAADIGAELNISKRTAYERYKKGRDKLVTG